MTLELGPVESRLHAARAAGETLLYLLVDPDRLKPGALEPLAREAAAAGVQGFLAGSSLLLGNNFGETVARLGKASGLPVILFPGDNSQVVPQADAILFLSLLSGRNPQFLIGEQVRGAPQVARAGLECLPTAYFLVEAGVTSSAQFMSASQPMPRHKLDIALAHGLAARCLGFRQIYLEAGSGAPQTVPPAMVSALSEGLELPLIVGGGITRPEQAAELAAAGASALVIGSALENGSAKGRIHEFMQAIAGGRA